MARLPRVYQKIFGIDTPSKIGKFGSLAAGSPTTTSDPVLIQSLSQFEDGWSAAVVGDNNPALQDMNALFFLLFRQLAYIFEAGVPEWDDETTYYTGDLVNDGAGQLYFSIQDTNLNHDVSDPAWWTKYTQDIEDRLDDLEAIGLGIAAGGATAKTGTTNLANSDDGSVFNYNTSGGAGTINAHASPTSGMKFTVKDTQGTFATTPVTFVPNGAQNLEGLNSNYVMESAYGKWTWQFDGTHWWLIS